MNSETMLPSKAMAEALLPTSPTIVALTILGLSVVSLIIYRFHSHPLSSVPGPLICRFTSLWVWYHSYIGDEADQHVRLHAKYGPVVRIGPSEIMISDGQALAPIYSEKGGFLKAPCYANFDVEEHVTMFSDLDPKHRATRSKAVLPLFSTANIRSRSEAIDGCVDRWVARLKDEAARSRRAAQETGSPSPVNVFTLSRSLAIDTVCSYLFGMDYGGTAEQSDQLSAATWVDAFAAVGRFFFLPPWLFGPVQSLAEFLSSDKQALASSATAVDTFTTALVSESSADSDTASSTNPSEPPTFQTLLLKAGISRTETSIQMKDLMFAGTDTSGTNLAHLLLQLTQHPKIYQTLRAEVLASPSSGTTDPQTLPYLAAVLRETLRTSHSNPTRFPRIVPPRGWTFAGYTFPPGTVVGLSPYTLHTNSQVFPDPGVFDPERWAPERATPEMHRDWMPFGIGARQCIARNLAMAELAAACAAVVREDALKGARAVGEKAVWLQWFNARVVGGRVELGWE